jgi:hypothetical protein
MALGVERGTARSSSSSMTSNWILGLPVTPATGRYEGASPDLLFLPLPLVAVPANPTGLWFLDFGSLAFFLPAAPYWLDLRGGSSCMIPCSTRSLRNTQTSDLRSFTARSTRSHGSGSPCS